MRLSGFILALASLAAAPSHAQQVGLVGPSFASTAVNAENFDTVFEVKVTTVPAVPLLRNQTTDARFDAVVCNTDAAKKGAVKADAKTRWGFLDPGVCTMFANFNQLDLAPADGDYEWLAKVYLRAKR